MRALTLKGDEDPFGAGVGRRGCDDATFGHDLSGELAADSAEVVVIERYMVRALCAPYELRLPLVGAMPSHCVRRWRILLPQYTRRVSRPRREGTAAAPSARLLSIVRDRRRSVRQKDHSVEERKALGFKKSNHCCTRSLS